MFCRGEIIQNQPEINLKCKSNSNLTKENKSLSYLYTILKLSNALTGNRTPVSRVAGEHSTTEPPMLASIINLILNILLALLLDL